MLVSFWRLGVAITGLFTLLVVASDATAQQSLAGKRPNIIFILAETQGMGMRLVREIRFSRRRTLIGCTTRGFGFRIFM